MQYDNTKVEEAEQFAMLNMSQKRMAGLWGVTPDTVTNWKHEHPEFAEAIERGYSKRTQILSKVVMQDAEKNPDRAESVLKKLDRETWGDINRTEITGKDGKPLAISNVNLTKEEQEQAILLAAEEIKNATDRVGSE